MEYIKLFNGKQMPKLGLGTWLVENNEKAELALENALSAGYRHFDTATKYENEEVLGKSLKKWLDAGNKREELFIVTKLPWIAMQPTRVEQFMKLSLKYLQLNYVDMYLVHWPFGLQYQGEKNLTPMGENGELLLDLTTDIVAIWKEMENQVDAGRTRSIGLSNFNEKQLQRIVNCSRIQPANLQVEVQAYFQQKPLRELCKKLTISVCAYGPLGSPGRQILNNTGDRRTYEIPSLMEDPVVLELAEKYSKKPAQILLRFLTQMDIICIPKSTDRGRMKENLDIFDFQLIPEEMQRMEELDKGEIGRSFKGFPGAKDHPECPF